MDLYSRKIIAWDISDSLSVESVLKVVRQAKRRRLEEEAIILHSDRGSQYVSREYQEELEGHQRSYSGKGSPWDNACIESFHALIKREWLSRYRVKNIEEARKVVFEYIETFYNTIRIHSACGYVSPRDYELKYNESLYV